MFLKNIFIQRKLASYKPSNYIISDVLFFCFGFIEGFNNFLILGPGIIDRTIRKDLFEAGIPDGFFIGTAQGTLNI
jgi:hypothetical protein